MKYLKDEQKSKDTTQQIFAKCLLEIHRHDITYFKSWLYSVTKNECLMLLRKQHRYVDIEALKANQVPYQTNTETELNTTDIALDIMIESMPLLPVEQQDCINLFYLKKQSYLQITQQLNLTYMQVKSSIQNGKRNLKKIIEQNLAKRNS